MEGGDQVSGSVWETDHQPTSLTSVRSDSGMNSMEYWDYTVELTQLECIGQSTGKSGHVHFLPLQLSRLLQRISCFLRVIPRYA